MGKNNENPLSDPFSFEAAMSNHNKKVDTSEKSKREFINAIEDGEAQKLFDPNNTRALELHSVNVESARRQAIEAAIDQLSDLPRILNALEAQNIPVEYREQIKKLKEQQDDLLKYFSKKRDDYSE